MFYFILASNLNTSLPQVNAQAVGIATVMIDEILQRPERRPTRDEKAAFVELPDPIVLDGIAVSDRQREIVSPRLGISDQECAVFVLWHQKLLLGLDAFDFAEVPSEKRFDNIEIKNI